jgi:hypothetical protein
MELSKYVNSKANLVRKKIESCRGKDDLMAPSENGIFQNITPEVAA